MDMQLKTLERFLDEIDAEATELFHSVHADASSVPTLLRQAVGFSRGARLAGKDAVAEIAAGLAAAIDGCDDERVLIRIRPYLEHLRDGRIV
jgi:hypothetical protein